MRREGRVACMGEMRNVYSFVEKPERKRPYGRPRCRWENIKMDIKKYKVNVWVGFIWLGIGTSGGLL
jgi:hypothetical protein